MELRDQIYETLMCYWELQKNNYDIELNYPELLNYSFDDPELAVKLASITSKCQKILESENPPKDPVTESIFKNEIAPVPNNIVLNTIIKAILAGGENYLYKTDGWNKNNIYKKKFHQSGEITVSVDKDMNAEQKIKSFSLFTVDVLMVILGQLAVAYKKSKTNQIMTLKTLVNSKEILKYKNIKCQGKSRWKMLDNIASEIETLSNININVKDSIGKTKTHNYQGRLISLKCIKRDYNHHTCYYTPTAWEIRPGTWATQYMSREGYHFIGKLNKAVLAMDHRAQRAKDNFAKKLMYSLFILPGGTNYIRNGVKKNIKELLILIGEYQEGHGVDRKSLSRKVKRLVSALDYLNQMNIIELDVNGNLEDKIQPWGMRKTLQHVVEIKIAN